MADNTNVSYAQFIKVCGLPLQSYEGGQSEGLQTPYLLAGTTVRYFVPDGYIGARVDLLKDDQTSEQLPTPSAGQNPKVITISDNGYIQFYGSYGAFKINFEVLGLIDTSVRHLKRLTNVLQGIMSLSYNNGVIQASLTGTNISLVTDIGFSEVATGISKSLSITTDRNNYIYFDTVNKDFAITTNIDYISPNDILIEAFYSYNNAPFFSIWASFAATRNGYPSNFKEGFDSFFGNKILEPTQKVLDQIKVQIEGAVYETGVLEYHEQYMIPALYKGTELVITSLPGEGMGTTKLLLEKTNGVVVDLGWLAVDKTLRLTLPEDGKFYVYAYYAKSSCVIQVRGLNKITNVANNNLSKAKSAKVFLRVGCIGDEYTAGSIHLSGEDIVQKNPLYSWPYYMANITGNKWDNFGKSGSTAKSWMENGEVSIIQAPGNKCQAYVIGLMVNDRDSENPYYTPVGTVSDIGTDADTYYAWYYKLIQAVFAVNRKAVIFCNTCPSYDNDDPYNQAVREIVAYCRSYIQKVYLCDLASEKYQNINYYQNPLLNEDKNNSLFTAIGYEYLAECFVEIMSDTINDNVADFSAVFKIPFDIS